MLTSRARNKIKKATWNISRYQAWTYDLRNSSVLRLRLNDANDEDDVTCDGRLSHAWAAATGKARPPSVFPLKARHDKICRRSRPKILLRLNLPTHAWIRRRGNLAPVHWGICRPAPPACSRSDRDIESSADHGGAVSRARFYGKRRSAAQTRWARIAICPSTDPWCRRVWHCRSQGETKPSDTTSDTKTGLVTDERMLRSRRSTAKQLDTTFETWVFMLTSQSRYIPRSRTEANGTMTSTPTRRPGCGIWCWRRMDTHQSISVLAVLSWTSLINITYIDVLSAFGERMK